MSETLDRSHPNIIFNVETVVSYRLVSNSYYALPEQEDGSENSQGPDVTTVIGTFENPIYAANTLSAIVRQEKEIAMATGFHLGMFFTDDAQNMMQEVEEYAKTVNVADMVGDINRS